MSDSQQNISFDLSKQGFNSKQAKTLLATTPSTGPQSLSGMVLEPFSVYIGEVAR
jgi:hypothetical protein